MKLVFASDSFKGSVTSGQTMELLTKAAHEVFGPWETVGVPVADGGEGTTEAVIRARNGQKIFADVHGPLMEKASAYYGKLSDTEAILEMAGWVTDLALSIERKDTGDGTGERWMVKHAVSRYYRSLDQLRDITQKLS